ncbi:MAG: hypothetical protein RIC19_01805 [Phaeodactylibacter sp.]|uniref:hypothetical protein n=1 Tax=Phaeodactylibacter sp. TaxID=1940289 RepID=UPI0032EE2FDC
MQALAETYKTKLEALGSEIQESEELQAYLEEEEEEQYMQLKELFEPRIAMVYEEVAGAHPLQLVELETLLLQPEFEGLYLPKILGFTVLRGEVDEAKMKYTRTQEHFKEVLLAICNSANFDLLRKRIGQSIQMGFALSSDIWVTNLINEIDNKRVRYFLQGQKLDRYRIIEERIKGYQRYQRQFRSENFMSAAFPEALPDLKTLYSPLKRFLLYRVEGKYDNSSIIPHLRSFVENKVFKGHREHLEVMVLYASFFDLEGGDHDHLCKHFNDVRKSMERFQEQYLEYLLELHLKDDVIIGPDADKRMSAVMDHKIKDDLSKYYDLLDEVHSKGYTTDEAQESIKAFYVQYQGLSDINECLRQTIFGYFERLISNLEITDYPELFEISKLYPVYMNIFANQQFNQQLKELSLEYVGKLLKHYTDKRGKDYQDIKKFVATTFQDLGFLKDKEVVEMFKTRRKRKKTS